jgi:hypothetical protein
MTAHESPGELAACHIAEQKFRITKQEILIAWLGPLSPPGCRCAQKDPKFGYRSEHTSIHENWRSGIFTSDSRPKIGTPKDPVRPQQPSHRNSHAT